MLIDSLFFHENFMRSIIGYSLPSSSSFLYLIGLNLLILRQIKFVLILMVNLLIWGFQPIIYLGCTYSLTDTQIRGSIKILPLSI